MLKSYEAVYENGQLMWVSEQPSARSARVIVTVIEELEPTSPKKPSESEFIQTFQGVMEKRRAAYEELA